MPPHAHRFVYLTVSDFWHQSAHNSAWHLTFYTLRHKFRQDALEQCMTLDILYTGTNSGRVHWNSAWHLIFYTLWHKFRQGANQCLFHIFKPGMKSFTPVTSSLGSRVNRSGAPLKQPWVRSSSKHMQRQQSMLLFFGIKVVNYICMTKVYFMATLLSAEDVWPIPKDSISKSVLPCAFFQYWLHGAGIINIYFKPCLLHTSGKRSCQSNGQLL